MKQLLRLLSHILVGLFVLSVVVASVLGLNAGRRYNAGPWEVTQGGRVYVSVQRPYVEGAYIVLWTSDTDCVILQGEVAVRRIK